MSSSKALPFVVNMKSVENAEKSEFVFVSSAYLCSATIYQCRQLQMAKIEEKMKQIIVVELGLFC